MKVHDMPDPTIIVIFGGNGDLTNKKLIPALYNLYLDNSLPEYFAIIAIDCDPMTNEELHNKFYKEIKKSSGTRSVEESKWRPFAEKIRHHSGNFTNSITYATLLQQLRDIEKEWKLQATHIFYLATPPLLFGVIPKMLADAGLAKDIARARIVVENPIGHDLESARQLNATLTTAFNEAQIFRIDHHLGKETLQNILAFRFANPLFEPIWNCRYIDHVTITVAEDMGMENHGGYYDRVGALQDMVQNHMFQLLCLVAMEPPISFCADEIRNKKVDVLHAIRPISNDEVSFYSIRGQYGSGLIKEQQVCGYREEEGVPSDSSTETFAAVKFFVDNWRWQEVPFYLRTGKRLPTQVSEVTIHFRSVPHHSFPKDSTIDWQSAKLSLCMQPKEGIVLKFKAKQPGRKMVLQPVDMSLDYNDACKEPSKSAYESLLLDVMMNDATLFMRADQVEAAWSLITPILHVWEETLPCHFPNYTAGTWGPEAAEMLLARSGRMWMQPAALAQSAKSS